MEDVLFASKIPVVLFFLSGYPICNNNYYYLLCASNQVVMLVRDNHLGRGFVAKIGQSDAGCQPRLAHAINGTRHYFF